MVDEKMLQVSESLIWQVEGLLRTSDDRYYREIGRTLASVLRKQLVSDKQGPQS